MIKVGLTGGIGSGKSLVSQVFIRLGIPVFNADFEAKEILNKDPEVIQQIKNYFGDIYASKGVDRAKLATIIFNDQEALKTINSIIHPKVHQYFYTWIKQQQSAKYVIEEAAILFESNAHKEMDFTINVHADELIRMDRVKKRDHVSGDDVKRRMKNQLSDKERMNLADFTIYNSGKEMVLPQILQIHHKILNTIK